MSAFATALAALMRNPDMAVDATYHPGGATAGVTLRVILSRGDREAEWQESRLRAAVTFVSLRVADAPDLAEGDVFDIGGDLMTVKSAPERDTLRLSWRVELKAGGVLV